VVHAQAELGHLVHQADFEGKELVPGVSQSQALSLVLAPCKELPVGVDGGLG
jgi:hypothetical protein